MAFGGTSGNNGGGKSRMALSEINVTPLVDVMLVLLIIFMVTTPMMQQGIDIELPETASSGAPTAEEPFVLVVKKNRKIYVGDRQIAEGELAQKLRAIFATRPNKQIYLQADRAVDYGFVAETMAEVRAAGIFSIGLVTVPKAGP
jgi:biopolymer transport protein TolR